MEGDKRGGSVAESERGWSVLYEYVPVISGASVISVTACWDRVMCLQ